MYAIFQSFKNKELCENKKDVKTFKKLAANKNVEAFLHRWKI